MSPDRPTDGAHDRADSIDVIKRNWRAEVETARVIEAAVTYGLGLPSAR
jgi:hypothetical protein